MLGLAGSLRRAGCLQSSVLPLPIFVRPIRQRGQRHAVTVTVTLASLDSARFSGSARRKSANNHEVYSQGYDPPVAPPIW